MLHSMSPIRAVMVARPGVTPRRYPGCESDTRATSGALLLQLAWPVRLAVLRVLYVERAAGNGIRSPELVAADGAGSEFA